MAIATLARPAAGEFAPYYGAYVGAVPEGDLVGLLERQGAETATLLSGVDEARAAHRYAPGKWTVRQVVGHMVDAERVFTFRALHFARGAGTPLPSFDENSWAEIAQADHRTLASHVAEFVAVRAATVALFRGFSAADAARSGTASGHVVTVRALAFITAGHERHHVSILKEKYGL